MTTKRKSVQNFDSSKPSNTGGNTWRGFVNLELSDASKEKAVNLTSDALKFWAEIESTVMGGYRLSVTFTQATEVFNATITGTSDHPTDEGIAVTARSRRIDVAIAAVLVKLSDHGKFNLSSLFGGTREVGVDL